MLYTVRPLERIYATPDNFNPKNPNKGQTASEADITKDAEYKEVLLQNGRIVTRRNGDEYVIERIHSTDMQDYLKKEYTPGNSVN